ncbi:MAG: pentapeptide repeat-containing protein [Nitrospirota bacterium]|nr:pentapeptide repeat-containing protein [Nitrospirota bacterium]
MENYEATKSVPETKAEKTIKIKNRWSGSLILELNIASLTGANLTGADLTGADMRWVKSFYSATFTWVWICEVKLKKDE